MAASLFDGPHEIQPGAIAGHGPLAGAPFCGDQGETPIQAASFVSDGPIGFFTNFGHYLPRTHCMMDESGNPDWPWIILLITLTGGVIAAYSRIYWFWMRTHRAQDPRDRNHKMFELASIFFWCAVCGYAFSIMAFAWPAYRLLAGGLVLLNLWSWKFVFGDLKDFKSSLTAKATERQLHEELRNRNSILEGLVIERTEALEAATQRAVDANLAKSRFLASMSHEIRTPMTAIVGYTQLLQDSQREGHDIDTDAALETITQNAAHLLRLIDDILDVSKIEAGRMQVERVDMNPIRLASDAIDLLKARATTKSLSLHLHIDTAVPRSIQSDPTRLRQILLNLLSNAVKFTKEGSVSLHVSFDPMHGQMRFTVRDTGIGMSAEQTELIRKFEAFTQADASTTREFGGTGLGLRISSALAHLLGGDMTIESELGAGSSITASVACGEWDSLLEGDEATALVKKPLLAEVIAPKCPSLKHSSSLVKDTRILIVDDGADNRRLFEFYFSRAGAQVTTANDGAEALRLFDEAHDSGTPFDLVLLDMQMPNLDGYTAARVLRDNGHTTPILAITANAMSDDRQKCLDAGCDEYISKPVQLEVMLSMCCRLLSPAPQS